MPDSKSLPRDFSNKVISFFFVISFLLSLLSLRGFLTGENAIIEDAAPYIESIKFFTDNIAQGVYPLWDPTTKDNGTPNEFYLRRIGEFNPLYWLIIVLENSGLNFYQSYLCFLVLNLSFAMMGFYLLSLQVFKSRGLALAAYLFLVGSTVPTFIFRSFVINLFVPIVWFFYFLLSFAERPSRHHFLGMILALMVIVTTYIPFYFVTIVLFFLAITGLIYTRETQAAFKNFKQFMLTHRLMAVMGFLCLAISFLPGIWFYQDSKTGELILPERHSSVVSFVSETGSVLEVPAQSVAVGGIPVPAMLKALFLDVHSLSLGVLYLPLFAFLLFLLGICLPVTRRLLMLYLFGFSIYIISLYDATPVYHFFYQHIFFFKFFRNFQFFFLLAILPIFILICVEHLKLFYELKLEDQSKKHYVLFFLVGIHALFAYLIFRWGNTYLSSYGIIVLSLIYFIDVLYGRWRTLPGGQLNIKPLVLLTLLTIVQSQEIFYYLNRNAKKGESLYRYKETAYLDYLSESGQPKIFNKENFEKTPDLKRPARDNVYFGLKSANDLFTALHPRLFDEYTQFKFISYDRLEVMPENNVDYSRVSELLGRFGNLALVSEDPGLLQNEVKTPNAQAQPLMDHSEEFKILRYNVNSITLKTNFSTAKFLVYNDAFHKGWRAWINGQPVKVFKANVAFKGLWVPAQENTIVLKFGSSLRLMVGHFLLIIFFLMFAALFFVWPRKLKTHHAKD